jgi:hypothetical protein
MSRKCWILTLSLASTLEEADHDAVIGDLTESCESGRRALTSVLGLVVRRQVAIWKDSHLWIVFLFVLLPVCFALCDVAQGVAGESAVYTWMYANNWDWGLAQTGGFWYVFADAAWRLSLDCLMVACWSWSAGLLLGRLPNKAKPNMRGAFVPLLVFFQFVNAPQRWWHFWMVLSGVPSLPSVDTNAPVTALTFYRVIFPLVFLGIFVALPALWGMSQQQTLSARHRLRGLLVLGACASVLTMLLRVPPGLGFLLGASGMHWLSQHPSAMRLLTLLAYWPILYLVAVGVRHFWSRRLALA